MKRKSFTVWLFVVTMVLFICGTVMATAADLPDPRVKRDGKLTVAVCGHGLEAESCQRDFQQYKIECAHRGWKMIDCMTAGFTGAEQRSALETLIQKNVDAIVLTYFDMEAVADLVIKARQKGIGVYNLDTEGRPGVILNVTQNNAVAGSIITYYGLHRMNLKGNVAILSAKWHILRRRAYVAATLFERDFPAVKLLAEELVRCVNLFDGEVNDEKFEDILDDDDRLNRVTSVDTGTVAMGTGLKSILYRFYM